MNGQETPLVSIINVTWNGRALLEKHLPSLDRLDYPNYEVIIVDNGSKDDSVAFVREHYPHFKILQNSINLGTAEGSNVALPMARGKYIFWVSNDMEFDPHMVTHLVARCEEDPSIGICTVKMRRIINEELKAEIDSVGADLDPFGFPASRGINEPDHGQWDTFTDIFFAYGGAMFIRRSVLDIVGGYDPEFLTLTDDIDLSWRVHLAGYRVTVEPKAFLYHRVSATLSTSHNRAQKRFISERNILRTLLKNYAAPSLLWLLPIYFSLMLGEMLFFIVMGRPAIAFSSVRAVGWNLVRLPGTLALRSKSQSFRTVSDRVILGKMLHRPEKLRVFLDFVKNLGGGRWKGYF